MYQRAVSRGFTLIEILVVVLLIGLMLSVTMLAPRSSGPAQALQNEAQRLQLLMEQARDRALLEGREYGLSMETGSYYWWRWSREKEAWSQFDDTYYRSYQLPDRLVLNVIEPSVSSQNGSDKKPLIVMFSDGQISPFELTLSMTTDRRQVMVLTSDGFSQVSTP